MSSIANDIEGTSQPTLREYVDQVSSAKIIAIALIELLGMNLPLRDNILGPWLHTSGLCMVYAKRGVGKTYFALEVCMAVASGGEFLDYKAPRPAKVLYIDGEMPANTMQARLAKITARIPLDRVIIQPMIITPDLQDGVMPDLSTIEGQESIREYTDNADLIIVDNISTLCGFGKENEAASWLPIQQWVLWLRRLGKSVLFIHHAGKSGQQRGTSKREDILDTVIVLCRPKDYTPSMGACFEVHFEKSRGIMGDAVNPITCRLTDNGWEHTALKEDNYQRVVKCANENMSQTEIAMELNLSEGYVSKLCARAKAAGDIK